MENGIENLFRLRGLRVTHVVLDEGNAGLAFEDGSTLSVYNKFVVKRVAADSEEKICGKRLLSARETFDMIILEFESSITMQIYMGDSGYTGPEALQLRIPGEPIVIWN